MGYSVVNVGELEGGRAGGAVRFVRRALGVQAFGINWIEIPPIPTASPSRILTRYARH